MPVSVDGILEATFDASTASVLLVVVGSEWPSPVDMITITRTVAGEATVPVRGVESRVVAAGYYVGSDHEMALATTVTYVVAGSFEGSDVATATVAESTTGAADGLWLKVAGAPDLTVLARTRTVSEVASPTIGGVYQIAGGGGSVAQTSAQWSGIESDSAKVGLSVETGTGVARLRAVMAASRILLLQPVGFTDIDAGWYFVGTVRRSNPASEAYARRWFDLDIQRTGVPAGQGSGIAGVTWAALMEECATWADVATAYATWFDVLRGA
jgi:hypothetical protein